MRIPSIALVALSALAVPAVAETVEVAVDFEAAALDNWLLPLPDHWRVASEDGNRFLRLAEAGPIGDPRRPTMFALWQPACVGDFELTVKLRRAGKSMAVAFGYQNRTRFYYAHLSSDDGNHAVHNGVFKVFGGSRYRIGGHGAAPALPTDEWQTVRIQRTLADDRIQVFMNDDAEPLFDVVDPSFRYGRVGLGSFNETGDFDDFRLVGQAVEGCPQDDYSPLDPTDD